MQDLTGRQAEGLGTGDAPVYASRVRAPEWLSEQHRLARTPGFLEATLGALRAQVGPGGQRGALLEELHTLTTPALVVRGARDRVFPKRQAQDASARLENGRLALIPDCGHLPQVERSERLAEVLIWFLGEVEPRENKARKEE